MAKQSIQQFSTTPASNTDIAGINVNTGWPPSNVGIAYRTLMAFLADALVPLSLSITSETAVTLSPAQASAQYAVYTGALSGDCTITLPSALFVGYVQNATTGGHNIILTSGGGTTAVIAPGSAWYVYECDGAGNTELVSSLGSISPAMQPVVAAATTAIATTLLNFIASGAGAVAISVAAKLGQTVSALDYGAVGDGVTDDTTAIQNAVTASRALYFPPGQYLITAQINVVNHIRIFADRRQVTIILGTQNQNGFVFGDGTSATRNAVAGSSLEQFGFNVLAGTPAFTSGSCIVRDYVYNVDIFGCDIYGADGGVNKLCTGLTDLAVLNSFCAFCTFAYLGGDGINVSGTSGSALSTDNLYEYPQFQNIHGDCIYFGQYTSGQTVNSFTSFDCDASAIHINGSAGNEGQNYFIQQPDIEVDGTGSGIWVQQGNGVQIGGGWIGGSAGSTLLNFDTNANTCVASSINFSGGHVTITGPANSIVGCTLTGDNVSSTYGIGIGSAATGTIVGGGTRIRQFTQFGIDFTSPVQALIEDVYFSNIGQLAIQGFASPFGVNQPIFRGCSSDAPYNLTAASDLPLAIGQDFVQVTGATAISVMAAKSNGERQIIQAGAGGITINDTGNIALKGNTGVTVPAFSIMEFVSDGSGIWIEVSRNF